MMLGHHGNCSRAGMLGRQRCVLAVVPGWGELRVSRLQPGLGAGGQRVLGAWADFQHFSLLISVRVSAQLGLP